MSTPPVLACARVRVLLEPFVDGDLARTDPSTADAVRFHLAGCEDCRLQHHQAVSLPFRLRALTAPLPPAGLIADVMRSIAPARRAGRWAWSLLAPEALLAAFILWYVSGLDGLASLASGGFNDLQSLAGWWTGASALPSVPAVDVLLLAALIALAAIASYHLSILIRLDSSAEPPSQIAMQGGRRA
jgi:predicted anti-sigma-YlaC factor YlaD